MMTLVLAALFLNAGCGTLHNLAAPPEYPGIGPCTCLPFGGVIRSGTLGTMGTFSGVAGTVESFGTLESPYYMAYTGACLVALADVPVSLAGDIVTLPIAFARANNAPWATWWGQQSVRFIPMESKDPTIVEGAAPAIPTGPETRETPRLRCPFMLSLRQLSPQATSEER